VVSPHGSRRVHDAEESANVANAVTTISPLFSTPYVTIAEFKQAPTAIDVDDLVGGGTSAINDQELANVIARASSWIDSHCGQVLASTEDTEALRASIDRRGFLKIHPRYFPITQVVSLSYGPLPSLLASVDVSTLWIEQQSIVFPISGFSSAFSGPIQFSGNYSTTQEQFVELTYVNGYPNTVLSSSVTASVSSLPVTDLTGFSPGQRFNIFDGASSEIVRVALSHVPSDGAGSLPLHVPTTYAHAIGINTSALPPAIKQAAIYVTSAVLKARGNAALVMQSITPQTFQTSNPSAMADFDAAMDILRPYRRIR
jgi:hypothetical protein